jgi:hypothetical protein
VERKRNIDVRTESADLKGALTTRTSSGTCTSRSAGSQRNLDAPASASRTSQDPAIFRMRPAASRFSFLRPACVSAARARIGLVPYGWCGSPPGDGSQPGTQEAFQMNRPNCKLWNQNEEEAWNRQPSR